MKTRFIACAIAATATVGGSKVAHAQAYERVAPQIPIPATTGEIVEPKLHTKALPSSKAVIIPKLAGIYLLDNQKSVIFHGQMGTGLHSSVQALRNRAFTRLMTPFFGKPTSINTLNKIAATITDFYRQKGMPFVYISIPPQSLIHGTVQVVVTEYKLDKITVTGNKWFSEREIMSEVDLNPGMSLSLTGIRDDIRRLNQNPFRTINAIFSPGTAQGYTDVTLQASDRLPVRAYGTYDTYGIPLMGRQEWALGGSWGNVAGLGHIAGYQFTHSVADLYSSHAISYSIPLPWRDSLEIFGTYAWEHTKSSLNGEPLNEMGHSGQASIRYVHPFETIVFNTDTHLVHELRVGYDFKTTNNNIEFGGFSVYNGTAEVNQFPIVYHGILTDRFGHTTFDNQLIWSPGGLTGNDSHHAFSQFIPNANNQYVFDNLAINRTTWLPKDFTWNLQIVGQIASTNLMYSNQFGLGGSRLLRGYFTDSAIGSNGIAVTNQINSPVFHVKQGWDAEQIGVFFDYGHVQQTHKLQNGISETDLSSIGLDLHAQLKQYISVGFNVGWRLHHLPTARINNGYGDKGAFGNVSLTVGF